MKLILIHFMWPDLAKVLSCQQGAGNVLRRCMFFTPHRVFRIHCASPLPAQLGEEQLLFHSTAAGGRWLLDWAARVQGLSVWFPFPCFPPVSCLLCCLSPRRSLQLQPLRDHAAPEWLQPCDRPVRVSASRHQPGLWSLRPWLLQPAQRARLREVRHGCLWRK